MTTPRLDTIRHPITDDAYIADCRTRLDRDGALVLPGFAAVDTIDQIIAQSAPHESDAFYAETTHNVYLTPSDPTLASDHSFNRQIESSKGPIADDASFRSFLFGVLGIDEVHRYADATPFTA